MNSEGHAFTGYTIPGQLANGASSGFGWVIITPTELP